MTVAAYEMGYCHLCMSMDEEVDSDMLRDFLYEEHLPLIITKWNGAPNIEIPEPAIYGRVPLIYAQSHELYVPEEAR